VNFDDIRKKSANMTIKSKSLNVGGLMVALNSDELGILEGLSGVNGEIH